MRTATPIVVVALLILSMLPPVGAEEAPPATVRLPLADYLALVKRVAEVEAARAEAVARSEPSSTEAVSQRTTLEVGSDRAEVVTTVEVEARGEPPVVLTVPVAGVAWEAAVKPAGRAALERADGGVTAVPVGPGRFEVTLRSTVPVASTDGVTRLSLAPTVAPVGSTEVDLPADLAWRCPGAVAAGEEVEGERRHLRFGLARGQRLNLELRREVSGGEAEKVLARSVVVTVLAIDRAGVERHDVVLYEVSRGSLSTLEVELPADLVVERLATDEGEQAPLADGRWLRVERVARVKGTGHLVVSSRPQLGATLGLEPVTPTVEVRARYLAVGTGVAVEVTPAPAEAWARVDLGDLPEAVRAAADAFSAAWRLTGEPAGTSVALELTPPAHRLQTLVGRRETTTLLTVEGTLLHRERLELERCGSGLSLRLPAGGTLWSSQVNGVPVRTVSRDGAVVVPLPVAGNGAATVEVVTVQERAVLPGRSTLELELPVLSDPVLLHQWRLLLPEANRYRFAGGDLQPAPWDSAVWAMSEVGDEGTGYGDVVVGGELKALGGRASLHCRVLDDGGTPLPGVTVTIQSDALPGAQVGVTDAQGNIRFVTLPSGSYSVRGDLPGFSPTELEGIRLTGDRNLRLDMVMRMEVFAEEIEVRSESPVVDTSQTSTGQTISLDDRPRPGRSHRPRAPKPTAPPPAQARKDLESLSQGLVGGVRPVPVEIPCIGKTLILEGALPPERVTVRLEVKAAKP